MQVDVYTTRRQGKKEVLNKRFMFHRTTKKRIDNAVKKDVEGHPFFIQNKEDSKRWIKSRD